MAFFRNVALAAVLLTSSGALAQEQGGGSSGTSASLPFFASISLGGSVVSLANPFPVTVAGGVTSQFAGPSASFTPSVSAYAAGYSFGGVQAIANAPSLISNAGMALSSGTFTGSIDLLVFGSAPSAYADNTAVVLSQADQLKLIGVIHLTDLTTVNAATAVFAQATQASISNPVAGGTLWVLPIVRAAVTFAASSQATLLLGEIK